MNSKLSLDRRKGGGSAVPHENLIEDLEAAMSRKDLAGRAESLRRITDLFVSNVAAYSGEQLELFDEVMRRLTAEVDAAARAQLGLRLATVAHAPAHLLRQLACDPAIDVALPVLQHAPLEDDFLVERARLDSQAHLLAISHREVLPEALTDVLVKRGDAIVVRSTAANHGARFSETGYGTMIDRAQDDEALALSIWRRSDVPRPLALKLFVDASAAVQTQLTSIDHRKVDLLREMVAQAASKVQAEAREASPEFIAARERVEALHRAGELDAERLLGFARARLFDEAVVALALLCDLPICGVERAAVADQPDQLIVMAKAIGLSWPCTEALIRLRALADKGSAVEPASHLASFDKLRPDTAKRALQFYRLREKAAAMLPPPQ